MNYRLFVILLIVLSHFTINIYSQPILLKTGWKFSKGDDMRWAATDIDDSKWQNIEVSRTWEEQGNDKYDGFGWYRVKFDMPSNIKEKSYLKDSLKFILGKIDDHDEVYLNGQLIGKNAGKNFPIGNNDNTARFTAYNIPRKYVISALHPAIKWNGSNVLAVRVYDQLGGGGMTEGECSVSMVDIIDVITLDIKSTPYRITPNNNWNKPIRLIVNSGNMTFAGIFAVEVKDIESTKTLFNVSVNANFNTQKSFVYEANIPAIENAIVSYTFAHDLSGNNISESSELPYLLTPVETDSPKINGAKIYGTRIGKPFLYKIPASGNKPMKYKVQNLPEGLILDENTGIITGIAKKQGTYKTMVTASNANGTMTREFTISIGNDIALTPPMGWNSWNCWGLAVSDEKVRSSAKAFIDKGLIDYGWAYVNIDDGWEDKRDANGNIKPNEKFPDMKALGDYLHSNGLKFGIYSSPGPKTCGGYEGSYKYEQNDANTYAQWGIDYLKYDWCAYSDIAPDAAKAFSWTNYRLSDANKKYLPDLKKPYQVMQKCLAVINRDIVYSLCQYGWGDVWTWGHETNGNLWRTTGDIEDTWSSLYRIGFSQHELYPYAKPGRWNDPDMLIVGMVGWGPNLHPTRLTISEQYTHISLWAMLSAPLLIGCDMAQLDDFTLNLLKNSEVIDINQDIAAKQAQRVFKNNNYEIYVKTLNDGGKAIAIFNVSTITQNISIKWQDYSISGYKTIRDVWRQKDMGTFGTGYDAKIPAHGCRLLKVY
ncbi:MAG: putative Ig domain-containing protein [Cytophagales bacterium]|nr:putative Ig domain-containing protein [Cytophagales bacterium]